MKAIIIFNLITNLIIIGVYLHKINPFYFEVQRTFWMNRPCGIMLWRATSYGATGIWGFNFRNCDKIDKKDKQEYFGEFNKY
jgi:hypothetical protein